MKVAQALAGFLFVVLGLASVAQAQEASGSASPAGAQSVAASPVATPPPSAAAAGPAKYVGSAVCKGCHAEQAKEFSQTMMGKILPLHARDEEERLGCEGCHGPGSLYIKEMAAAMGKGRSPNDVGKGPWAGLITFRKDSGESAETDNQVCMTCHEKGAQASWRASTHAFRGLRCVDCHIIMRAVSPRFQLAKAEDANPFIVTRPETQVCLRCHLKQKMRMTLPSHMPLFEGLMTCTDCHNPHGGPYPDQLVRATVNQTCYTCHAEKRGPFLWMHPPVVQNCLNCHDPHGSINRSMLKLRPPRLCQQCHIGAFHPGTPAGSGTVFVFSRACTNCHSAIHGSNAPGGVDLTR